MCLYMKMYSICICICICVCIYICYTHIIQSQVLNQRLDYGFPGMGLEFRVEVLGFDGSFEVSTCAAKPFAVI